MDHLKYPETVSHIVYSLLDSKSEDISILFDGFYQLVEDSMKKGSLLVHCAAGISRVSHI
jgi:protein-tyrosine phosphatase